MSTIKIVKSRIAKDIYLLRFKTQYELAATFLRVQEHYESPRFHGRIFSLEQFMDWYAKRYGNFTYYEDWAGFNVPSTALQPFYEGKFDPLSEKEKEFLPPVWSDANRPVHRAITRSFFLVLSFSILARSCEAMILAFKGAEYAAD